MGERNEFDVCVIGTGAGGGVMLKELTAAGFDVVALERGAHLASSQFTDDELSVFIRDELFSPDQLETYRLDDASATTSGRFNLLAHCVGGTITHWAGWSWRFRPDEFRVLSAEGPVAGASLADWPFGYEELEPFYEKAEWEFGVAGDAAANQFGAPRKKGYPNPPHPVRRAALDVEKGARKLGWHPFPLPMAINSQSYEGRPRCLYGGACNGYGCPIGAKATSLSVLIPKALATKRLDLRPNAMVRELVVGKDGRVRSARYLDRAGGEHEVRARHFVLAGGPIGSPHVLLMSKSGSFPDGLANSSGFVGKNLTYHLLPYVLYFAPEPTRNVTGFEGNRAIDDLHASDSKRGFIRGGVIGDVNFGCNTPINFSLFAASAPGITRAWGADFKRTLAKLPRAAGLVGFLEDLPMESNRVELDPVVKDRLGLPAPRITHRQHPNDLAMQRWFTKRMLDLADASGATEKWEPVWPGVTHLDETHAMPGSLHVHGTCRMGDDPKKSVVDRWCRTHDVPNLWVVDGSFFPTSGGYNPTLTILANAYRVADHFVREAKKRNL